MPLLGALFRAEKHSREFPVPDAALLTRGVAQSLCLRVMSRLDYYALERLREANRQWLEPWEATSPDPGEVPSFSNYVREMLAQTRRGAALPLVVVANRQIVGSVTISNIVRGSAWSASIGYWISRDWAGWGITPAAVATSIDICFDELNLHRVEICVRPENAASLAVVRKLGLREEGVRPSFLHINGAWVDHRCFAINDLERPVGGMRARLMWRVSDHCRVSEDLSD